MTDFQHVHYLYRQAEFVHLDGTRRTKKAIGVGNTGLAVLKGQYVLDGLTALNFEDVTVAGRSSTPKGSVSSAVRVHAIVVLTAGSIQTGRSITG
jgi:hypothetical protein